MFDKEIRLLAKILTFPIKNTLSESLKQLSIGRGESIKNHKDGQKNMRHSIFNLTFSLLFLLGIQTAFGQNNTNKNKQPPTVPTQNYCFRIIEPDRSGCPVGENIPYGTPLLEAIRHRNIIEIKRLIAEGANVNEADARGLVPLILASRGDLELIDILLAANANVNIEGLYGATPLGSSTICSEAVAKFLQAGADVNFQKDKRPTALMLAAQNRNIESVKLLLDAGADVHAKDFDEMTPLLHAVKSGSLETTKFLYEKGGKNDLSNEVAAAIALFYAASNAQPEMMKFLLQTEINPNVKDKNGLTAITTAAMRNNTKVAQLLIEAGANANITGSQNQSPLSWAAQYGSTEIVKLLLAAKADVNPKENWSPLINAARHNHVEVMEILINAGAKINLPAYDGRTALMDAATGLNMEAVKFLIKNGADINARDKYNNETVLSQIKKGILPGNTKQSEIIQLLMNAGAVE